MATQARTAKTASKSSPLRTLKSRTDAATSILYLGKLLQRTTDRKARLSSRIARNQARVDADRLLLGRLNQQDEAIIVRYAHSIFAFEVDKGAVDLDVLTSTKEIIIQESTGIVRFYVSSRGKLICNNEELTAREILAKYPELFFKLVKCTIRKEALKNEPEVLATLETTYTERGASMSVEPINTKEAFRRPLTFFTSLRGTA